MRISDPERAKVSHYAELLTDAQKRALLQLEVEWQGRGALFNVRCTTLEVLMRLGCVAIGRVYDRTKQKGIVSWSDRVRLTEWGRRLKVELMNAEARERVNTACPWEA